MLLFRCFFVFFLCVKIWKSDKLWWKTFVGWMVYKLTRFCLLLAGTSSVGGGQRQCDVCIFVSWKIEFFFPQQNGSNHSAETTALGQLLYLPSQQTAGAGGAAMVPRSCFLWERYMNSRHSMERCAGPAGRFHWCGSRCCQGAQREKGQRRCVLLETFTCILAFHEMTRMDPNTTCGSGSKHVVYRMHDAVFSKRMKMARVLGSLR